MHKIPKYINKPLRFLGFELIDIVMLYVAVFYAYVAKSTIYLFLLLAAAIYFIQKKKKSPQGFCKHILYYLGLYKVDRYPAFSEQEFLE
jgi:type IV conjugative transfer system protein TraL